MEIATVEIKIARLDDKPRIHLEHTPEERFKIRYTWVEVCFNSTVASQTKQDSDDFKRGISWYAAFRWFLGNKNSFLDELLDEKNFKPEPVTKQDYDLNQRTWMKWIKHYGW